MTLNELGLANGTDKASSAHDYLRFYERRLSHLRGEEFLLIEIGVYQGGSTQTWAQFFPRATIVGIDIDESCRQYERKNISIRIGDASRPDVLFDVIREFGRPLVVVDDGSHRWDHQIQSFQILFPVLLPSGFFIMEDLHTSFEELLIQYPFQGHSAVSGVDYLASLARRTVADTAFGSEKPHDLFVEDNHNWVSSVEFARRTAVISKKASRHGGPA